ncbi:MAG TPA: hypothetical protein VNK23_06360 [Candidatus Dormibacteraeota bacterium]|nr:hypothetical protein [Candidatus Dormibacteraeota bacterium]
MTNKPTSSRRTFLKNGAILAVPLAAAAAPAVVLADDGLKSRLAKLEDQATIRELHQNWLRQINRANDSEASPAATTLFADDDDAALGRLVRGIAADHFGEPDAIEVSPDGRSAAGRFHCVVETGTPIAKDCTLAQMAHAQGSAFVRSTERRVLNVEYIKTRGAWSIAKAEFAAA